MSTKSNPERFREAAAFFHEYQRLWAAHDPKASIRYLQCMALLAGGTDEAIERAWQRHFTSNGDIEQLQKIEEALRHYGSDITFEQLKDAIDPLAEQR